MERPAPGLGRGRFEGPLWLVALLGALALVLTAGYYLRRLRRGPARVAGVRPDSTGRHPS